MKLSCFKIYMLFLQTVAKHVQKDGGFLKLKNPNRL